MLLPYDKRCFISKCFSISCLTSTNAVTFTENKTIPKDRKVSRSRTRPRQLVDKQDKGKFRNYKSVKLAIKILPGNLRKCYAIVQLKS